MVRKLLEILIAFTFIANLSGCDNSDGFSGSSTPPPTTTSPTAAQLVIATDKVQVLSDGSNSATITVTALDSTNALVVGALITFSTPAGVLSDALLPTDANGKASVTFRASAGDPTNQTVTITASAGTATASVPVQIAGSTIAFTSATSTQLTVGGAAGADTATLTLTALDAGASPVYNVPVTVTVDPSSTAGGQLDPSGTAAQTYTANTDPNGQITVDVKGTSAGTLVLSASALGATATKSLTVVTASTALQITAPADLSAQEVNTSATVTITVPSTMSSVTLATSLGQWVTVNGTAVNSSSYTATGVAGTTITATITSVETGTATLLVFDSNNVAVSDSIKLYFVNTLVDANSNITIQAAQSSVPVSVGNTVYSVTLNGRVTDASNNGIADAPVSLSLQNQPGGGEYIDPPYVFSGPDGSFTTTFYSGSIGSDSNGIDIVATLVGNGQTAIANIIISQTAGSVVIGRSTVISSINNDTGYDLPMSVQVADANGSPVANATVSLKVWPKRYHTGYWVTTSTYIYTGTFDNEDVNRNLIKDPGEDQSFAEGNFYVYDGVSNYYNSDLNADGDGYDVIGGDGLLTPPSTSAGAAPPTVTTDANGLGTFDLVYLKANALWIDAEVTATVQVQGSESVGVLTFTLPALQSDIGAGVLSNSPYNYTADTSYSQNAIGMGAAGVGVRTSNEVVNTSGTSTLTLYVVDASLTPVSGATVNLAFEQQGSDNYDPSIPSGSSPTLSATSVTTGSNGTATVNYTAGGQAGLDVILIQYNDGTTIYTNHSRINVQ